MPSASNKANIEYGKGRTVFNLPRGRTLTFLGNGCGGQTAQIVGHAGTRQPPFFKEKLST